MAITIPVTDAASTRLLAEITALGATGTTSTQHLNGINAVIANKQRELMLHLVSIGKVSYSAFMANETYGL